MVTFASSSAQMWLHAGIDIAGLPYVVNMTLPDRSEDYIHRVGRVGEPC